MRNRAKTRRITVETHYPDVFLTINRNRLRIYNGNSIFLNQGDEFELEFDNTTRTTWLAKIKLNGEWVSEAGLVLRPGEHTFLDTPNLDSYDKKRFRFETYEIESGRSHLVQDNGRVEVFFHKKEQLTPNWLPNWTYTRVDNSNFPIHYCSGGSGLEFNSREPRTGDVANIYSSNSSGVSSNLDSNTISVNCSDVPMEETGRVEEGSHSNQDFVNTNEDFESYCSHTVEYIILPISKKNTTIQDVKEYCSDCGRRRRKSERYCSSCGTKF